MVGRVLKVPHSLVKRILQTNDDDDDACESSKNEQDVSSSYLQCREVSLDKGAVGVDQTLCVPNGQVVVAVQSVIIIIIMVIS